MNTHRPASLFTRPGGNLRQEIARRVGAPNTQQSGEILMVGTCGTVDVTGVTAIHARLAEVGTSRFLDVTPDGRCVRINLWSLSLLVNDLLTERTAAVRAERAGLWRLLKDRVRAIIELARQNDTLYVQWFELTRGLAYTQAERDAAVRESQVREDEIVALGYEIERLRATQASQVGGAR